MVYYLLGEEFDRDPFLIFKLRGMSREEFLGLLGESGKKSTRRKTQGKSTLSERPEEAPATHVPLTCDLSSFWEGGRLPDDLFGEVRVPRVPAALPRRLGNFPFWRGKERFLEALEPIYEESSPIGMEVFLGQRDARSDAQAH